MKLLELQRRMAADLYRPLTPNDNLARAAKASDYVRPNSLLTSRERLEIYARSYWYRVLDSLYEDFPGLRSILGDEAFHTLSRAYLTAHPSQSYTLRDLGQFLEAWLRPRPSYTAGKHALALDMVRLEWAHIVAFDGLAEEPLGPEDLLEFTPRVRLRLQPLIGLLELDHAVDRLRISLSREQELREQASNTGTEVKHRATRRKSARRERSPIFVGIHRVDDFVYYRRLRPEEYRILSAIRNGDTVGKALEQGFAGSSLSQEASQEQIGQWFSIWSQLGWLAKPAQAKVRRR